MAASQATADMASPAPAIAVVDARFCAAEEKMLVVSKPFSLSGNDFTVKDSKGATALYVEGAMYSFQKSSLLLDLARRPVLTMQYSAFLMNTRWEVFRGDSTSRRNLLFSVVKSSVIQMRTKIHVFLARNTTEEVCDFSVGGSYHDGYCTVYLGHSDTIIAKINRQFDAGSALVGFGRNKHTVIVNPGIDYAFIVALAVILDEMHHWHS